MNLWPSSETMPDLDWDKQEHVAVYLRRYIRYLLTKYKFPLDKAASVIRLVMAHFELFEAEVTERNNMNYYIPRDSSVTYGFRLSTISSAFFRYLCVPTNGGFLRRLSFFSTLSLLSS
jgi:hypothetical protein